MPRAHRYHLPGYIWHITHRCHHRTASAVDTNTLINPSPSHLTSSAPCAAPACFSSLWCARKMRCARSSSTCCSSSAEFVRSVNSTATERLGCSLFPHLHAAEAAGALQVRSSRVQQHRARAQTPLERTYSEPTSLSMGTLSG